MEKQMSQPIIHYYSEVNPGKFSSEKHYELDHVLNGSPVFTEFINISIDGKSAKSRPYCWLKIRKDKKWKIPTVTGRFKTNLPGIFKNDCQQKTNLIIVKFGNDASQVNIYYFKDLP